jgi:hypothetical protein
MLEPFDGRRLEITSWHHQTFANTPHDFFVHANLEVGGVLRGYG